MSFQNRIVWLTGASSGIGLALAHELSRQGATLILSSRNRDKLEEVRQCAPGNPEDIHLLPLDLSQPETLKEKATEIFDMFGRVDLLINNAGISQRGLAEETSLETRRQIMETNFFGTTELTAAVLPSMIAHHSGHIVVVSSVIGKFGAATRSTYAASKHALHGYFDSLRCEVHQHNIDISLICPGYIRTDISRHALEGDGRAHDAMDPGQARGMCPEVFAKRMLRAIVQKKEEVFIGGREVWGVHAKRLVPGVFSRVIRRLNID